MLLVKTFIAPSKIHGLGLFADEDIKKRTVTWKFNSAIDILITKQEVNKLPREARNFIEEYGSLSKLSGKYVLSADNTRFTNHSSIPNLDTVTMEEEPEAITVTNRDITRGEELTVDYKTFDELSEKSNQEYLI